MGNGRNICTLKVRPQAHAASTIRTHLRPHLYLAATSAPFIFHVFYTYDFLFHVRESQAFTCSALFGYRLVSTHICRVEQ